MSEDVSGGRLYIDAYLDTSGATRGLQKRLDAETAKVRAKIKAEIDTRGIVTEARTKAREASAQLRDRVKVRLQVELDDRSLQRELRRVAKAHSGATIQMRVDADVAAAAAKVEALRESIATDGADVKVGADVAGAVAEAKVATEVIDRMEADVEVKADTTDLDDAKRKATATGQAATTAFRQAGTALTQVSKIPALAGGFYMLGAAIVQAGAGLVALASSAASAAGTLAVIPNLIGVAGQGIGVLVAGFSGIGDAVTALGETEAQGATQATALADAQVAAARRVEDAQRALADARHQAGDSARAAAEAVRDAEWSLMLAQEGAKDAQDNLNRAREQARERIADLNEELRLTALDEESASEAVVRAQENLQDVQWNAAASPQEIRDAQMALAEAERDLERIQSTRSDLAEEAAEASAKGVKGDEGVIDAKRDVRDANHALQESEEALRQARHDQADAAKASARAIADAQRNLVDAQKAQRDAAEETTAVLQKQNEAMDKLSPAGRAFARFIANELIPRFRELRNSIQQALLPPVQSGIEAAMPFLDTLETGLVGTATVLGTWIERLGKFMGSKAFNDDVSKIMGTNNEALRIFLRSVRNLVEIFTDLAVVAGPKLLVPFAKWTRALTQSWKESVRNGRENGKMADWFDKIRERAGRLASIVKNVARALFGVGKAANKGAGDDLLKTLDRVTRGWAKFANSKAGEERIEEFFRAIKPAAKAIGDLAAQVAELFAKLGESGSSPITWFAKTLTKVVEGITALLDTKAGPALGWLFALSGVAGALGMVAGLMLKFVGNIVRLGKVGGMMLKFVVGLGRGLVSLIGWLYKAAFWIGTKIPVAMRLLSLAFAANPVGVIIGGLILLGGILVWMYKKFDWFKNAVDAAFRFIVDSAKWLWDVLFGHSIFPDLVDGIKWVGRQIGKVFDWIKGAIRKVGAVFTWLWDKAVKPAWNFIWKIIKWAWQNVYKPYFTMLWKIVQKVGDFFTWLWEKAIKPAWNAIRDGIRDGWNKVIKPMLEAFRDFVKVTLPNAFEKAVGFIADAWDGIKAAARKPVEFVVNTVYNQGIRRVINAIPGVPDLDEIHFAKGGVLGGYTPGRDVHRFWSPTGGRLALSGGEAFMIPQFARLLGGSGAIDFLNAAAARGRGALAQALGGVGTRVASFAKGGMAEVGGIPTGSPKKKPEDSGVLRAIGRVKDFVTAIPGWFSKIGGMGEWGTMMLNAVQGALGGARGWINDRIPGPGPIPNIFDRGGAWASGTLGLNLSGSTETVLTNQNMVDVTANLATLSRSLRGLISTQPAAATGLGALVDTLNLTALPDDVPKVMNATTHELRKIRRGGVHARRAPGASV